MFSIVIPLYNKQNIIIRTLTSVLEQNFDNYEVIIVNDGSTDKSVQLINAFTSDERIKLIEQPNRGVSVARNRGVEESSFDYIAFLDGDDEWENNYLETVYNAISKFPQAGMISVGGIGRDIQTGSFSYRLANKYVNKTLIVDFFENPHVFGHISATVVAKSSFEKTVGFPVGMKKNEDFAFLYSLALVTPVVYIGQPLSIYNGNVDGQATQINAANKEQSTKNVADRFNITYNAWLQSGSKSKLYITFTKYEIRHLVLIMLKDKTYNLQAIFFGLLHKGIKEKFPFFELSFYKIQLLREVLLLYIFATKLMWRMKGYPVTGECKSYK